MQFTSRLSQDLIELSQMSWQMGRQMAKNAAKYDEQERI